VEYEKRSNSGLINTHGMNPEGGDMRQSRKQEERLENEASQAQRNFRENQRLSFPGNLRRIVIGRGRIYTWWEDEEPVEHVALGRGSGLSTPIPISYPSPINPYPNEWIIAQRIWIIQWVD